MIFSDRQDSHDKRVDKTLERGEVEPAMQTKFSLVGIRRRLNNIEMAASTIVALLAQNQTEAASVIAAVRTR